MKIPWRMENYRLGFRPSEKKVAELCHSPVEFITAAKSDSAIWNCASESNFL